MIVAADHPARGALGVGERPRSPWPTGATCCDRLRAALADPGWTACSATPDILDDLLLLGALEDKVVFGSINRGGLRGRRVRVRRPDDRPRPRTSRPPRMNGGKMLCRIDLDDPGTVATIDGLRRGGRRTRPRAA